MFSSEAVHRYEGQVDERRSCRRATLQWVVLVFFGGDQWGKLVDLSERGMCFQFEHPPALRQSINFTFEAMGCTAIPTEGHEGKVFGESIQATGRVKWTREFERTAGVEFVELSTKTRDLIRYWLSSAAPQQAPSPGQGFHQESTKKRSKTADRKAVPFAPTALSSSSAPYAPPEPAPFAAKAKPRQEVFERNLENRESDIEVVWEPEPPAAPPILDEAAVSDTEPELEDSAAAPSLDEPAARLGNWRVESRPEPPEPAFAPQEFDPGASERQAFWESKPALPSQAVPQLGFETRQRLGQTLELRQRRGRIGTLAILGFMATFGAVAGIIRFTSTFSERAETTGLENKPAASGADAGALGEATSTFLVEVLDSGNRRSVLLFSGGAHANKSGRAGQDSSLPEASVMAVEEPAEEGKMAAIKPETPRDFTLSAPHPATSATSENSALEAPAMAKEPLASVDAPLQNLPSPAMPGAPDGPLPVGGEVQPARLIHAMVPSYPQMARANR